MTGLIKEMYIFGGILKVSERNSARISIEIHGQISESILRDSKTWLA